VGKGDFMFDQLPETYPARNRRKPKTILAAGALHVTLVAAIIMLQMAAPDKIGELKILTTLYMASPPPPPPPLPPPSLRRTARERKPKPGTQRRNP